MILQVGVLASSKGAARNLPCGDSTTSSTALAAASATIAARTQWWHQGGSLSTQFSDSSGARG
eukprot:15440986-Alexandrium_andersonii.AAC.1